MTECLEAVQRNHGSSPYSRSLLSSGLLAEGVEWWAAGSPDQLPWAGTWYGPTGIRQFFDFLGGLMDYQMFEIREYVAQGSSVVTVISAAGQARATGNPFASDIVRVYAFE